MGTYKFYKLEFSKWADRIEGKSENGEYWKNIFIQHPEFFRLDQTGKKASLVWRRNYPKNYNVDSESKISKDDFIKLSENEKKRVSRSPLTNSDISTLISTAINLHGREIENKKDSRWWISAVFGLLGVVIGALINASTK